jgi:hypothetical protein
VSFFLNIAVMFISDSNRLYPFKITVDGATCATVTSGGGGVQPMVNVTCSPPLRGRKVRLQKTGGECCLNLCELEIYRRKCTSLFHMTQTLQGGLHVFVYRASYLFLRLLYFVHESERANSNKIINLTCEQSRNIYM